MSARTRYEALATAWDAEGRPSTHLLDSPRAVTALKCWLWSGGAKAEAPSPLLSEFLAACDAALGPGWYDGFLEGKATCGRCFERYRVENLAICTACGELLCHGCIGEATAPNGNRAHDCGPDGEMVG